MPGGTHAPHHPTPEWIEKISDMHLFDEGWNKLREQIFANQKRLGVIPQDAKLTPWPKDLLKEWDQLTADEKKMFIRQVGRLRRLPAYTDHEIGRVIQAVEDMGKLDNTLIIYISGDNGSSAEGTLIGTPNEVAMFNGVDVPVEDQLKYFYDAWGSDQTYNHMAVAWTWAFDTPFSWTKQVASHFGGTRQGMAISWPKVIKDKGGIRHQFHHVIDIVPTILEATRIQQPEGRRRHQAEPDRGRQHGLHLRQGQRERAVDAQDPVLRDDRRPRHLSRRLDRQHQGHAAAVGRPGGAEGERAGLPLGAVRPDQGLDADEDVAAKNPEKLKEMQELFWKEAAKYQVLPLDAIGGDAAGHAAAQHHGRPQRVHLDPAADRHAQRRCARAPQHVLHHQGRDRDSRRAAPRAC